MSEQKQTVVNITFYDSEDELSDENDYEDLDSLNLEEPDEVTEDLADELSPLLEETCNCEAIGKKKIKLNFFDTSSGTEFLDQKEECDFDKNENGILVLPSSSEEYIKPYLYQLLEKFSDIDKVTFITNYKGYKFNIKK
jgi:hypothetical protein